MRKRTLYVPINVNLQGEVWRGLSVRHGVIAGMLTTVASIISAILYFTVGLSEMWCALLAMTVGAGCVGMLQRPPEIGMSMADLIGVTIRYIRQQKRYDYIYRR